MLESAIEIYLKHTVEKKMKGLCIKFVPDFFNGFPDRMIILPGGKIMFIELKAPGKKPRKLQLYVHEKLRGLGCEVLVIDTKKGVDKFYEENI